SDCPPTLTRLPFAAGPVTVSVQSWKAGLVVEELFCAWAVCPSSGQRPRKYRQLPANANATRKATPMRHIVFTPILAVQKRIRNHHHSLNRMPRFEAQVHGDCASPASRGSIQLSSAFAEVSLEEDTLEDELPQLVEKHITDGAIAAPDLGTDFGADRNVAALPAL